MAVHQITSFEAGKYYVMTPPGEQWGDYEGPWNTKEEALTFLKQFINEGPHLSPEMLKMVVVHFDGKQVDLVKADNGSILNGDYLVSHSTHKQKST